MAKETTDLMDYDTKPLTQADVMEQTRLYMEKYNTNDVRIAGDIRSKYLGEAKQKMSRDAEGKYTIPVFSDDGSPVLKEPYRSVTIAFNGGEMSIAVSAEMFENVDIGKRYLFEGVKGVSFGSVQDIFHRCFQL